MCRSSTCGGQATSNQGRRKNSVSSPMTVQSRTRSGLLVDDGGDSTMYSAPPNAKTHSRRTSGVRYATEASSRRRVEWFCWAVDFEQSNPPKSVEQHNINDQT